MPQEYDVHHREYLKEHWYAVYADAVLKLLKTMVIPGLPGLSGLSGLCYDPMFYHVYSIATDD